MINNPTFCTGCRLGKKQVKLVGPCLWRKTASEVYTAMKDKNMVVIHVAKIDNQDCAFAHFKSHDEASAFFTRYKEPGFELFHEHVNVQPTQNDGVEVTYTQQSIENFVVRTVQSSSALPSAAVTSPLPATIATIAATATSATITTTATITTSAATATSATQPYPWKRLQQQKENVLGNIRTMEEKLELARKLME
ncbi:uncharacterized protein BYT42DRAFT_543543 [Radiomyces spectabilis]|uniref:uncharacterized protein n=1 Tax=Radiomyces spectabilis TaxID=64574 RepID=UPI00221FFA02|nr:uncharacterized protein BYT42DRAFT_543543 [Radiomyces spectabilis]KAI8388195.1 hypothetical protein BYT42DRAFT_543543 [Radiomyces spectabilis]